MTQPQPLVSALTLAATPNAVSWARRHTVDVLRHWQFPDEGIEVARLLVSELATNAIRHAHPAPTTAVGSPMPGTVLLRMWITTTGVVLAVGDSDPRPPTRRSVDESATGGRGLLLTAAMARRWGYYQPDQYPGKFVWAEVSSQPLVDADGEQAGPLLIGRVLTGLREL